MIHLRISIDRIPNTKNLGKTISITQFCTGTSAIGENMNVNCCISFDLFSINFNIWADDFNCRQWINEVDKYN